MSVIDTLITDRTLDDVSNRTPLKCAADYVCLNRVEEACAYIADYLGVDIETKTWDMEDWRKESDMERIRGNIQALIDAYYVKTSTPSLPTQIQYTSVTEANNIEKILRDIDSMYQSMLSGVSRLSFKLNTKPLGMR